LTEPDRVQSRCYKPDTAIRIRLCQLVVFTLVKNNLYGHVRIEIPYPALFPLRIPHLNPIKTRNPAPAHICNSRFPPLVSAQIPNITAKKKPNPASRQTYWGPSVSGIFVIKKKKKWDT